MVGAVIEVRTVRAMKRVATRYPADQWPGEPLAETGVQVSCEWCKQKVDLCDSNEDKFGLLLCIECLMRGTHPVSGEWVSR